MVDVKQIFNFEESGLVGIGNRLSAVVEKVKELESETDTWAKMVKDATDFQQKQINNLIKDWNSLKEQVDAANASQEEAFKEGQKSSEDYQKAIKSNNTELQNFEKELKKILDANKETGNQAGILNEKIFELRDSVKELNIQNVKSTKETNNNGKAQTSLISKVTKLVARIGGAVAIFTLLFNAFKQSEIGAAILEKVFAGLDAVTGTLTRRVGLLLSSVVNLLSGNFQQAGEDFKNTFTGIGEEISNTYQATLLLNSALEQFEEIQNNLNNDFAAAEVQLDNLLAVANNLTKSTRERLKAQNEANALQRSFTNDAIEAQQIFIAQLEKTLSLTKDVNEQKELQTKIEEANVELSGLVLKQQRDERNGEEAIAMIQAQRAARIKKANDERLKQIAALEKAINSQTKALDKQLNSLILNSKTGRDRAKIERQQAFDNLALLEQTTNKQIADLRKLDEAKADALQREIEQSNLFNNIRFEIESKFQRAITEIEEKEAKERIKKELERQKALQKEREAFIQRSNEIAENQREIALLEVDLITESTSTILTLEEQKAQKRLEIEKAFLNQKAFLLFSSGELDEDQAKIIALQIEKIDAELNKLSSKTLTGFDAIKNKILGALGLSEEEANQVLSSLSTITSSIFSGITASLDAEIKAATEQVKAAEKRVSDLQTKLDAELEKQQEGLGNNVESVKAALEEEEKVRDAAAARQAAAEEKRRKLRVAQLGLETSATLVNSIINIINTNSKIPIVGVLTGIAQVGIMLGAIAKFRSEAQNLTKFSKGGLIDEGHAHSRGGAIIEAEKGEFVVRKDVVSKGDNLKKLEAFNNGESIFDNAIQPIASISMPQIKSINGYTSAMLEKSKSSLNDLQEIKAQQQKEMMTIAFDEAIGKHIKDQTSELSQAIKSQVSEIFIPNTGGTLKREYKEGNTKKTELVHYTNKDGLQCVN